MLVPRERQDCERWRGEVRKTGLLAADVGSNTPLHPTCRLKASPRLQRGDAIERLRSDFWVAAYLRRCASEEVVAVLRRRGAAEAGAIFVKVDRLDRSATLYAPAPQSDFAARGIERRFGRAHTPEYLDAEAVEQRLAKEIRFDPDVWIIEVEDRRGRCFLDLAT